jgi:hypothetical protein
MATKKKSSNKKKTTPRAVRSKPRTGLKPTIQAEAESTPVAQTSKPRRLRREVLLWLAIAVLAFVVVGALENLKKNRVAPVPTSSVSDNTPSTLQVVGGEGASSTGTADMLQPQPSGLQSALTTQPANNTNLQAPNTPQLNPATLPD